MEMLARLANLPGALPGACAQGLIWGIMAIGVYLTYRILDVADLTVDGSFGTGGAVCVMCLLSGMNVWAALFIALLAGLATGLVTGLLHTFMGIPAILAGILTQRREMSRSYLSTLMDWLALPMIFRLIEQRAS